MAQCMCNPERLGSRLGYPIIGFQWGRPLSEVALDSSAHTVSVHCGFLALLAYFNQDMCEGACAWKPVLDMHTDFRVLHNLSFISQESISCH